VEGILERCRRRRSRLSECSYSNPRLLGPLFAASTYVSLRCSVLRPSSLVPPNFSVVDRGTIHNFLCPHRPPMLDLTSFSELYPECFLFYKFTVAVSSYVARHFGCFIVSVVGRSNAPRWAPFFYFLSCNRPTSGCDFFFSFP